MRVVTWLFNLALFLLALGFALSNTDTVTLRFIPGDLEWRAPLVVFLLIFLAAGVALGLLAAVPALFRHRREIVRLSKELKLASRPAPPVSMPTEGVPDPSTRLGV